jgi:hypothetical protein
MAVFQIHDGRLKLGEVIMSLAEYAALRPELPLPELPDGIVTARWDSGTGTLFMSDGANQRGGSFDAARAADILADAALAGDLAALREEG